MEENFGGDVSPRSPCQKKSRSPSHDHIGNRTRDLSASSTVPHCVPLTIAQRHNRSVSLMTLTEVFVGKNSETVPIPREMNTLFLSEIFVLIFQSLPSLYEVSSFMFLNTSFVDFFAALFSCYVTCPSKSPSFDHLNLVT